VSTNIDNELRAAFYEASEFVQPRPGLANLVRRAAGRQRRTLMVTVAAAAGSVVLLIAAGVGYAAFGPHRPAAATHQQRGDMPRTLVNGGNQVTQLAASGRYVYLLTENGDTLAAYDRSSGKLIRQVTAPSEPSALAVGPGDLVWLAFYANQNGGPTGTWLLSPDLRRRSYSNLAESVIVPVSRTTAFTVTQYGLVTVRMPLPGHPGRASQHLDRGTSVGPSRNTAAGVWAGWLDGRIVTQVTNGYGLESHLVIAGEPDRVFGGSQQHEVGAVTSTGSSLWVQLFAVKDNNAAASGPLIRLDGQLRVTTPAFVRSSSVLTRSEGVWSEGGIIWVASAARGHSLVCFAAGRPTGPVTTVMARGSVTAVASVGDIVYVGLQTDGTGQTATVVRYRVPATCR
jgi:hypothetical protein